MTNQGPGTDRPPAAKVFDRDRTLASLGGDVAARILAQGGAASWWHPVDSVAQAIACAIAAILVVHVVVTARAAPGDIDVTVTNQ